MANQVYELCRAEKIQVVGFPNFTTVVNAIQNMRPEESAKDYQVTVKKHDKLVILQALAEKWMDSEFKDTTMATIEEHNQKFNPDGEFWHEASERLVDLSWIMK